MKSNLKFDAATATLACEGNWTLEEIPHVQHCFDNLKIQATVPISIDGKNLNLIDTSGVLFIWKITKQLETASNKVKLINFDPKQMALINLITAKEDHLAQEQVATRTYSFLYRVGARTVELAMDAMHLLSFVGEITIVVLNSLRRPSPLQLKATLNVIDVTGFRALPIIGLLSFMIGVVLTYQMGLQLQTYGANIYVVDLLGISILREFGPLITAIVVAGRTSSSFTAEIGTMKIKEEIDALRTMGINPHKLLVLPKITGLVIALPLLSVWADICGILGGMVMAGEMLDINYADFLVRFQHVISLRHFLIGIGKAPVFALIIAVIGCFHGLQVSGSADSVGKQTTKSVVFAIFCIIVADAIFSVLFSWQGI